MTDAAEVVSALHAAAEWASRSGTTRITVTLPVEGLRAYLEQYHSKVEK